MGDVLEVRTASGSAYLVNEQQGTLLRCPAGFPPVGDWESHMLRRDWEVVPLHRVQLLEVGKAAIFLITVAEGVLTIRYTTPVVSIKPHQIEHQKEEA